MNPEGQVAIEYGEEVLSPSGKGRRTISKVAISPKGTKTTLTSKVQRWKWKARGARRVHRMRAGTA